MHEEGEPLWKQVFGNPGRQEREEKALARIPHRPRGGAILEQAIDDDYVRRNLS